MKDTKLILLLSAAALLAGCATVREARRAQETDTERTVRWAETPFAARTDALGMEELADWARTNAPAVVQARQDVVQAQIALRAIKAAYVPVVDGSIAYTYASQNIDPHDTKWDGEGAWGGNLSLNWLLYDFGRTRASTRRAVAALAAADRAEREAENGAVYAVRAGVYAVNRAKEMLKVATAATASYEEHLRQTKDRFDVGAAMNYDVSKANVDYQNARLSEISARNGLANARASLALALGLAESPDFEVEPADAWWPRLPEAPEALMEIARTNAPALAALRARAEAAKDYVDWTICDLYPTLSLRLTFDAKGDSSPLLWNYAAAPAVAQTLFSAGAKNRQIETAVAQLRAARSALAEAEQKTWNAILAATLEADRAKESLSVAQAALDAAEENFEVVSSRYDVGKASSLERTDAQVAVTGARANVISARYDWFDAKILLARLVGDDSEDGPRFRAGPSPVPPEEVPAP